VACNSDHIQCETENPDDCYDGFYCPFKDQYGGGASISGVVTKDIVQVGPFKTSSFNTFFGQILTETGSPLENSGVDGIFGLAYQVNFVWLFLLFFFFLIAQRDYLLGAECPC
jgi:hypothetical protein